jgi:hypothetical protein
MVVDRFDQSPLGYLNKRGYGSLDEAELFSLPRYTSPSMEFHISMVCCVL